jgi:hypothetical protein
MKNVMRCLPVLVMLIVLASVAYRAARANSLQATSQKTNSHKVVHIYQCQMRGHVTEAQVEAAVLDLLTATKAMVGGEGVKVQVLFPVAVNDMGENDFSMVVTTPSFTAWGKFWDAFNDDSPVAKWDNLQEDKFDCPNSSMWEAVNIEEK